jgi:glucosamine-phosphate N-acetyltransferase
MIVLLHEILSENPSMSFVNNMKTQMTKLYSQLSVCDDIATNVFLQWVQHHTIFVDIDERYNIKGAITVILERKMIHSGKKVAHIEDVVVDSQWRYKKIGSELLKYAIKYAQDNDCYKTILNCSEELIPFYAKHGFTTKNVEMSYYFTNRS